MNTLRSITTTTPDGDFHIIIDDKDVARASGFGTLQALANRLPEELRTVPINAIQNHPYEKIVRSYYQGDGMALDSIPRSQSGSDFQKTVWQAISDIPYGKTISYKELAIASENPAAIRVAGTICGLNKLILLIPCHRVLKSDGSTGSYLYGSDIKDSLLQRESSLTTNL